MSTFARLVVPLPCVIEAAYNQIAGETTIPAGVELKSVRVNKFGGFSFAARLRTNGAWVSCTTDEDLPAFTDKGLAARARRSGAIGLGRGRPMVSSSVATIRLVCKVTQNQYDAVAAAADRDGVTIAGLIRNALKERGMPE